MADYKRVVSYIYNYESRQKKNNVGYSRVESRNNQCKVTIHLNTNLVVEHPLKVYLFHRSPSMLDGVYFGVMNIKNGTGDFRGTTNPSSLMGTEYTINDISGVIIYNDDDCFFGSQWDDEEIRIENFKEYKPGRAKDTIVSGSMPEPNVEIPSPSVMEEAEEAPAVTESEPEIPEPAAEPIMEEPVMEELVEEESETQPELESEPENSGEGVTIINLDDERNQEMPEEIEMDQRTEAPDVTRGVSKLSCNRVSKKPCCSDRKAESEDVKQKRAAKIRKERESYPECVQNILNNFPTVKPFPNSIPENWVRIEPKDIGMLPVEAWILANNSFLLHGYYNYRHLIFGVLKMEEGTQFVIGVPGILHTTEQTMANMFGFNRFLSSKNDTADQGNFGYWIQQIVL